MKNKMTNGFLKTSRINKCSQWLVIALFLVTCSVHAATYYSQGSVALNTTTNWNTNRLGGGTSPANFTTAGDIFVIQGTGNGGTSPHAMTLGTTLTIGSASNNTKLQIENGASLTASSALTFGSVAIFQIDNGGTYNHGNTTAYASSILAGVEIFGASSNFVINSSSTTGPGTPSTGFGNLTFAATASCNSAGVLNDGASSTGKAIQGNFTITGVSFRLTGATATTATIGGDLIINGGTFDLGNNSATPILNIGGNFTMTTGTFDYIGSATGTTVNFTKSGTATFAQGTGSIVATTSSTRSITFNVNSGCTLDFGTNVLSSAASSTINFSVASGGGLITANTGGITAANTASGCIQNLAGTRTYNAGGNYTFNAATAQVTGTGLTGANNLTINNSTGVSLSATSTVSGALTLTSGKLSLGNNNLTMSGSASSISGPASFGASSSNYIVTNGTGNLVIQNIGSGARTSAVLFPIGASSSVYNPVTVTNSGTSDNFSVRAAASVPVGLTSANAVNNSWIIAEGTVGGSMATIGLQWNAGDQNASFDRANCAVVGTDGTAIVGSPSYGASSGTGPYTRTLSGQTSFSSYYGMYSPVAAAAPTVTTTAASSITSTSASSGGNVTADGGATITERGIVYNTSSTPTTANTKVTASGTTGTFTSSLTGLNPGVTYYVRAYAINSVGTSYGSEISFTTLALPTVTTASATSITSTSALSGGNVTADGGASITERGVVYNTASSPTTANNKITTSGTTGSFISSLSGLSPGTTYYVRAYAINSVGTSYGNEISFTTSTVAPTVITTAISSIAMTSASTGGNVTSDGGASITERGVVYGTSTNPTTADTKNTATGTTGSFTSSLTGLTPGTTYYVRAYAINSVGTSYGSVQSFTTLNTPTVTTTAASSVTLTGATSGGNVTSDGGSAVTERGIVYSISSSPTTANTKVTASGTTGSFTSSITGLNPGVTYYVRAYAINNLGTSYGNEISFTTLTEAPTVTTSSISSIAMTSASTGGNVTSDGGAAITERGVVYGTSTNPTTADTKNTATGTTGSFTSSLTGLTPGTTYYVRAYAINSVGTSYGSEQSFTTLNIPTVSTASISIVTSSSAYSGGNVTANGGSAITERGIVYSTITNPTTSDTKITDGSATTGSFTSSITGLSVSTTYYVRAYAINAQGTAYGSNESFTTTTGAVAPGVTTAAVSNLGSSTVTVGGTLVTDGGDAVTERGIVYGSSSNPTTADTKVADASTTTGSYSTGLTGLTPGATYYVRAYAINGVGTSYGDNVSFTMNAILASVSTTSASSVTSSSASSGGNVTADGGGAITERGIVYATSANPTTSNIKITATGTTGLFTSSITGLTQATTYYVRAYAINAAGTAYGSQVSFTTLANTPTAATATVSNLGSSTVTVGGSLITDGGDAVTERGIVYGSSPSPTTADTKVADASTAIGSYTADLTGLTPGATYYVRAYAINSIGTSYGSNVSFTMNAVLATVSTTAASSITSSSATSGGNVTADGGDTVTERGIVYSTSTDPTTSNTKVVDGSTGTGTYTSSLNGLAAVTTYYVRAYAINSAGTSYGANETFTTLANAPTVTTTAISSISGATASGGGNVTSDGGAIISERGIVYSTSANPTIADTKIIAGTATTGSFASSLTGLAALTTYYVRAYATNSIGTSYGSQVSFTTISAIPSTQATGVNFTSVGLTSMTINFTPGDGANSIVVVKATTAVNSNPVNTTSYTANTTFGSGTQIGTGNFVVYAGTGNSVSITGLTAGSTYHVAVYSFNGSSGTENYLTTAPATGNQATANNNYRSVATGNWNATSTWEVFDGTSWVTATSTPSSSDGTITIQNGHTVTVSASVTADEVTINAGGQITVAATQTLTIANGSGTDLTVNGYLKNQGTITNNGQMLVSGTYEHNFDGGTVPTATWNTSATCLVTGIVNSTTIGGCNQNFYHFTWNCPSQTTTGKLNLGMFNNTIGGNFSFLAAGTVASETALSNSNAGTGSNTITINGDLIISANTASVFGAHRSGGAGSVTSLTVVVKGNFNQSGGNFKLQLNTGITFTSWTLDRNFTMSAGTFQGSNASSSDFHFTNVVPTHIYTKSGGTFSANSLIVIDANAKVDLGTSVIDGSTPLTINAGATITSASTTSVFATTGTKTLSATANYIFNGTSAQTLPAAITGANNITINNAANVTLGAATAVTGTLTLTSGDLILGANNLTLTNAISGANSTNYIVTNGAGLLKYLSIGNTARLFPVGNSTTSYTPLTITNTGTTNDISVGSSATITNAVFASTKVVNIQWTVTPGGAGAIVNTSFSWNAGNNGASFNNSSAADLGVYTASGPYTIYSLGTLSGNTASYTGLSLANSANLLVIGNKNAVFAPQIVGFDVSTLAGGSGLFGASPYTATTLNANLTSSGLVRGSGLTTSGTAAAAAWGAGGGFNSTTSALGISGNKFFTFTVKPNNGYSTELLTLNPISYRTSTSGPNAILIQYQINSGPFVDIVSTSLTTNTTVGQLGAIDLSGIAALSNVQSNQTVTFRFVPFGASGATGTFYINNVNASTASDFALNGNVNSCTTNSDVPVITSPICVGATSINGTSTEATGTVLDLYVNNTWNQSVLISSGTWSATVPSLAAESTITAYATASGKCLSAVSSTITVTGVSAPTASAQSFCSATSPTVASLVATGTAIKWYDASSNGNLLSSDTALNAGTYYASQTVASCESTRTSVVATINTNPSAPTASAQSFCSAASPTVASLVATGTAIKWYDATTNGNLLSSDTALNAGTYYASQTVSSCESTTRTSVAITITTNPSAPTASAQSFCSVTSPTVASLVATGTAIQWYDASSNGNLLASGTALSAGSYYASQTVSGCESTTRTAASVTLINSGTWTGGSGLWSSAANWCGGIPATSDNVVISSGNPILDINHTVASGSSLTLSGTATLTLNPNVILTIAGTADFGGKSVTLKSDATGTAAIGQVNTLNGATNVTVERYIPAKRAWRALTAPLKGSNTTLYNSWQNAGVAVDPFNTGLELWGPSGSGSAGNGLATGPAASIRQYTTSGWADITNTQTTNLFTSSGNNAYMVFVTGGYGSNNIGNGQSAATTLKATGQLITGTQTVPVTSTRHTLVANPFASPLSPAAIMAGNTQANLYTNIWMWDPAISTNGAYVNYDASINNGTFSDDSGSYTSSTTAIQSGQAFFVRAVSGTDSLTLTETMKSSSISNTFRNNNSIAASVFRIGFAKQIGSDWMPLDGCIAAFYDAANPAVDPADGTKMVNTSENVAFVRGTTNLSIEHYPLVNATDQLNVKIWNTQQAHYKLKLNTEEFTMVGVEAYLQDLYTGTTQPLTLDGSVQDYEFDVDPTVSASSGNRFRIVFANTALVVTNPEQGQLSIYPNPATGGKVTVSLPTGNFEGCSYELINVLGQVVRQDEINNSNSSQVLIPITGLPNSWYALRIMKDKNVMYQGKLIIKN